MSHVRQFGPPDATTDHAPSDAAAAPVTIDRVDRLPGGGVRVSGRRLRAATDDEREPMLVLERGGARQRFPALEHAGAPRPAGRDLWEASFDVPAWMWSDGSWRASLWIGTACLALEGVSSAQPADAAPGAAASGPPPSVAASCGVASPGAASGGPPCAVAGSSAGLAEPSERPAAASERPAAASERPAAPSEPAPEPNERPPAPPPLGAATPWPPAEQAPAQSPLGAVRGSAPESARTAVPALAPHVPAASAAAPPAQSGRAGPLEELLLRESTGALRGELQRRTADEARLRAALAAAESQLRARASAQAELEATVGQLRGELQELIAAASCQREQSERRVAELDAERLRLQGERDRLAAERDRLATERDRLTAERDRLAVERDELRERLVGAEAERDRLRERLAVTEAERGAAVTERDRLREQLAAATVAREAAAGEAESLRSELERVGLELALAQEQLAATPVDLTEAQRLLARARELSAQLRGG